MSDIKNRKFKVWPVDVDRSFYEATYDEYMKSHDWRVRSEMFKQHKKYTCEQCGLTAGDMFAHGGGKLSLHVHHKHYRSLGNEMPQDVEILCTLCHKQRHSLRR